MGMGLFYFLRKGRYQIFATELVWKFGGNISEGDLPVTIDDEFSGLPGPGDRLFESSAAGAVDQSDSARGQAWHDYIDGYLDAANLLVEQGPAWNIHKLVYPILFLYRQHLVLMLKAQIQHCRDYLRDDKRYPKVHEIDKLWRVLTELLDRITRDLSDNDEMRHTERLIDEFCLVDPNSESFRFPENRQGHLHPSAEIDLGVVKTSVEKISLLLDYISTDLHERQRLAEYARY